jgi:YVTN family beta-propeller protein
LDVGKTPVHLALKPDGGELAVCNFDSNSISMIETNTNEVGSTYLIGTHPTRALATSDNARLYVSNFGSNAVAVYDIDSGKVIAAVPVGDEPDALALSASEDYLLVVDSGSGDVAVIEKRKPTKLEPGEYGLLTITQVGLQPNNIAVKAFRLSRPVALVHDGTRGR